MRVAACPKAKLQNECSLVFLGVSFQHGFERFTTLDGIGGLVGGLLTYLFVDAVKRPLRFVATEPALRVGTQDGQIVSILSVRVARSR